MANQEADNAKYGGKVFWWTVIGANTAVVWTYTCPVDTHKVVSVQRLGINSAGSSTGSGQVCPLHSTVLSGETATSV